MPDDFDQDNVQPTASDEVRYMSCVDEDQVELWRVEGEPFYAISEDSYMQYGSSTYKVEKVTHDIQTGRHIMVVELSEE